MKFERLTAAASMGTVIALLLACTSPVSAQEAGANPDEATQAYQVLKKYCYRCHGETLSVPNLRVLDRDSLTADRGEIADPYVVPGKIDSSAMWDYIDIGYMPPETAPQPSDEEKAVLKSWIENGAVFPLVSEAERPHLSLEDQLKVIGRDLFGISQNSRPFQRYFSLSHLHNNPKISELDMRMYRAALSKAINSLSRESDIVVPEAIDGTHNSVFRIDLRDVGWDKDSQALWNAVRDEYPYGIKPTEVDSLEYFEQIEEMYGVFFDGFVTIRGDWFTAVATRPPLYHKLLEIPDNQKELTDRLGIDIEDDFKRRRINRGGVFRSGVSAQNRVVDRHSSGVSGTVWVSYDFFKQSGRGNVARFPLGPSFEDNEFASRAFEHAGSEIIFSLPNGLSGYMLIEHNKEATEETKKNTRIDTGPVSVVYDKNFTTGSPEIVNGVSCMACHKHGIIPFNDAVREGHALFSGSDVKGLRELYTAKEDMNKLIVNDQNNYLRSLTRAIGPFLQVDDDKDKPITKFPEPVSEVTRKYEKDLHLEDVAYELGMDDPQALKAQLNRRLIELGLGPLKEGNTLKRGYWESRDGQTSPMQDASKELAIGIPVN